MRKINEIIIHCSATREGQHIDAATIDRWHRNRGWSGIGYHYVIHLDGTIEAGRDLDRSGAHCKGRNANSIGICYIGGVEQDGKTPKDTRTTAQKISLQMLVSGLNITFGGDLKVYGHNEFAAKACPSFDVSKDFALYR